ncbi:MAG: CoB--CoM heterodisulfide reductase iron-sulfur subunit B family protein [Candidatus Bathyarchaeia archaeon]
MRIPYYPGCTLYTRAKNLEDSTRASAEALGIELVEIPNWTCCGATFSMVDDSVMTLVAPVRNLAYASKEGDRLVTTCAFCYNTLKRANRVVAEDADRRRKINDFIEEEYQGNVRVVHLLELLRDDVGFETLGRHVERRLGGLRVAPYYGCMLLRPFEEVGIDDPEDPRILEDFLQSLGCEVAAFPYRTECCGSYLTISSTDVAVERSYTILDSALTNGAEAIVQSCPLCHFNLDQRQREISTKHRQFRGVPVLYFTQLLGLALGIEEDVYGFHLHYVDPRHMLRKKGFIL